VHEPDEHGEYDRSGENKMTVRLLDFPTSFKLDEFLSWSVSSLPELVDLLPPLPSITSAPPVPQQETTQDLRP
jgi:hypothetical protein